MHFVPKHIQIMNTKINQLNQAAIAAALALIFAACSPKEENGAQAEGSPAAFSESLLVESAPADALTVVEARAALKPGDSALVKGQIGGVLEPFFSGYAGFILADSVVVFCDEMADAGHCSTPWDACCEDTEQLKGRRVTVQFVDAEGAPIEGDLKTQLSLEELDTVTVIGEVAASSTPENMIINASSMALAD